MLTLRRVRIRRISSTLLENLPTLLFGPIMQTPFEEDERGWSIIVQYTAVHDVNFTELKYHFCYMPLDFVDMIAMAVSGRLRI